VAKSFFIKFITLFLTYALFTSCGNKKKLVYFQNDIDNNSSSIIFSPKFQVDDIISVLVTDIDPELVKPFNLPTSTSVSNLGGGYSQGLPAPPGYLISSDSTIDFPIIGKVKMAGLNRKEAIDILKGKLKPYLKNPGVQIRILNFKITVLGEVKNPGTFTIPNERITLPEAIGLAGDLLISGIRKNILVIRTSDGTRKEFRIDMTSNKVFSSPVFYLNQNDVIYVQPNRAKLNSANINATNVSLAISVISILLTVFVFLKK
jgi:polysaccharide export outer membrane protein